AQGTDPKFLLSFGPFDIFPGETLPITFAYLGGERLHTNADDFNRLLVPAPQQPTAFYESLNFNDFGLNSRWASWIYDNPGVDTDGDGYKGRPRICVYNDTTVIETALIIDSAVTPPDTTERIDTVVVILSADTTFYAGDGVPDFRGASPPPAPKLRVTPAHGRLVIRWNGLLSETTVDPFSGVVDFEGYRVYSSRTAIRSQFSLLSSYDHPNYNRFRYDEDLSEFVLTDPPFTLAELKEIYGQTFDPVYYGLENPLVAYDPQNGTDVIYYFAPQDYNQDNLTDTTHIHKPYRYRYNFTPTGDVMLDAVGDTVYTPFPHTFILDSAFTSDTFLVDEDTGDTTWYLGGELTEDGTYFKYFEYEYHIESVLP
ncbi:MAG TPA: hypothetical protein VLB27_01835, partial [candidate division Zixibacteria bacterium]|nr:hypothetical protein [candidate division Zixibacteria bacterium]